MIGAASRWTASLAIVLAILGGAGWIGLESGFGGALPPLSGFDGLLYDAAVGLLATVSPSPWADTVVVLIDRPTLEAPGWASTPRALQQPQLGHLGQTLFAAGARKVGYDLVVAFDPADLRLPDPPPAAYDRAFVQLLGERSPDIVLGTDAAVAPARRYAEAMGVGGVGAIDLQTGSDGIVRSAATRVRLPDGRRVLGFAEALARDASGEVPAASRGILLPRGRIGSIPHISAAAVEACSATPEGMSRLTALMRGRVVVVGAALSSEDVHRGPDRFIADRSPAAGDPCDGRSDAIPRRSGAGLPGAFLQAAMAESLMEPRPIALADAAIRIVANIALAALALLARAGADRIAILPARRGWLLATSLRSAVALTIAAMACAVLVVGSEAFALRVAALWVPVGPTLELIAGSSVLLTMAMALRRDLALADLRIAFGRWLPAPVVEAALRGRTGSVVGEERVITVLIADLRQFTSFCADHRAHPERIVHALNEKFTLAQGVIDRHGGCLDKFDGDAVIAFWNGIEPQPDHACRAVLAARDLVEADRRSGPGGLRFKAAVATGVAFVGRYGSEHKSNFSAIGEPMNLAARLETLCNPHGLDIVIAESTVQAAEATPGDVQKGHELGKDFMRIGEAVLKGFSVTMSFYTLVDSGLRANECGYGGPDEPSTNLIEQDSVQSRHHRSCLP